MDLIYIFETDMSYHFTEHEIKSANNKISDKSQTTCDAYDLDWMKSRVVGFSNLCRELDRIRADTDDDK